MQYTIQTERLGLRNWQDSDLVEMAAINRDPQVMQHFPSTQSLEDTRGFIDRMQKQFSKTGYCYFAAERLSDQTFLGFIGIMYQDYEADFTPCVDIGWRLGKVYWGQGFATEGAKACLEYAFEVLALEKVYSLASLANVPSMKVMEKIGMKYQYDFDHPKLLNYPSIKTCSLYLINKSV